MALLSVLFLGCVNEDEMGEHWVLFHSHSHQSAGVVVVVVIECSQRWGPQSWVRNEAG